MVVTPNGRTVYVYWGFGTAGTVTPIGTATNKPVDIAITP
jgi:hypothetical protein